METGRAERTWSDDPSVGHALARLIDVAGALPPGSIAEIVDVAAELVGATRGRVYVADYALRHLQALENDGRVGDAYPIDGTLSGRAFASGELVVSGESPTVLWVPLSEGSERIGVLELIFDEWNGEKPANLDAVVDLLVLIVVSKRRYTDVWHRTRRAQPLSDAAEAQWDLLPPLTCSTDEVALSGILEPAYSIGGDSFDYALNPGRLEFAIVDAAGHGMPAVLMSVAAINGLRNSRREEASLESAYHQVDRIIAEQFGQSYYVTGQIASLDLATGVLTWLNAGHPLPMLVRDGTYVGELQCKPSIPMGLGGPVVEVASQQLQRGDRILFYTDGITEPLSPDGERFGPDRLADFLVRATLDQVSATETARRLCANVIAHGDNRRKDDATLFLVDYRGRNPPDTSM
jgi:serine phosphatase RsbU (regulator of sigma subunit)